MYFSHGLRGLTFRVAPSNSSEAVHLETTIEPAFFSIASAMSVLILMVGFQVKLSCCACTGFHLNLAGILLLSL